MGKQLIPFALALLPAAVAAQNTWTVDPSGAGQFTSLYAAQNAAADGDTLILNGSMPGVTLTKSLNIINLGGGVYTPLYVTAPGPLSIRGSRFEDITFVGTKASLDGVTTTLRVQAGATVAARDCVFFHGAYSLVAASVDAGTRAVFDGCDFTGRSAYIAFGVLYGTPAMRIHGHAELRDCTVVGGDDATNGSFFVPGGAAIELAGSVDLRDCQLSSGLSQPLITGSGLVRAQGTITQGGVPNPAAVTIAASELPWTTGSNTPPGGVLQVSVDGPATALVAMFVSFGMRPPTAGPFGEVWVDPSTPLLLVVGTTNAGGVLATTVAVPSFVPLGLRLTFQSLVDTSGGVVTSAPAILQVL